MFNPRNRHKTITRVLKDPRKALVKIFLGLFLVCATRVAKSRLAIFLLWECGVFAKNGNNHAGRQTCYLPHEVMVTVRKQTWAFDLDGQEGEVHRKQDIRIWLGRLGGGRLRSSGDDIEKAGYLIHHKMTTVSHSILNTRLSKVSLPQTNQSRRTLFPIEMTKVFTVEVVELWAQ